MEKLKLGIFAGIREDVEAPFRKAAALGLHTCQIAVAADNIASADPFAVRTAAEKFNIEISCVFVGFSGQVYNLQAGPGTMGLVAPKYRDQRLKLAKECSDFVKELGTGYMGGHIGFIPDDETDPVYKSFIPVMKDLLVHCKKNGQFFCFETGQELPSTLARTISDLQMPNAGINLDPANLILYGKANPLDAVEIFGENIRGMHAKDGLWPNRDEFLGKEVPIGEGMVNFPVLLRRLKARGYDRPVTIEREISGEKQIEDIKRSIKFLSRYL